MIREKALGASTYSSARSQYDESVLMTAWALMMIIFPVLEEGKWADQIQRRRDNHG